MNASLTSVIVCSAVLLAATVHSATLVVESADYTAPRNTLTGLSGGTGWAGPWTGSGMVSAGGLSRGLFLSAGNRFTLPFAGGTTSRPLNTAVPFGTDGTTLWASFLLRNEFAIPGGGPGGLVFLHGTNEQFLAGVPAGQTNLGMVAGAQVAASSRPAVAGQTNLLVIRMRFGTAGAADMVDLFVNPAPDIEPSAPDASLTLLQLSINQLGWRAANLFASADELRLADSFAEVAPAASLGMAQSGDQISLQWPRTTQTLTLLFADSLFEECWSPHPAVPVTAGSDWRLTDAAQPSRRFYRLFRSGGNVPGLTMTAPLPMTMAFGADGAATFHYTDADCDLAALEVTLTNELGTTTTVLEAARLAIAGTGGDSVLTLSAAQLAAGANQFRLVARDRDGLTSAPLDFTVQLGGSGGPGATPAVTSLTPQSASVVQPAGALSKVRVPFTLTWSDADADVERVRVRVTGPGTNTLREYDAREVGISGTGGTVESPLVEFLSTNATGNYTARVTLIDVTGHRSPEASAVVTLASFVAGVIPPAIVSFDPPGGLPGTWVMLRLRGVAASPADLRLTLGGVPVPVLGAAPLSGSTTDIEAVIEVPDGASSSPFVLRTPHRVTQSFNTFAVPAGLVLSPPRADVRAGETLAFVFRVGEGPAAAVQWGVEGTGNGTITADGVYTAPAGVAATRTVRITATMLVNPPQSATAGVTLHAASPQAGFALVTAAGGGMVGAAGQRDVVLLVPPSALTADRHIAVTAMADTELAPPPAEHDRLAAARLLPEGLTFAQPATLRLPLRRTLAPGTPVILRLTSAGGAVEMLPATLAADGASATASVPHFSTVELLAETQVVSLVPRSIATLQPGEFLEEGRTVPIRLTGVNLDAGLVPEVLGEDGTPVDVIVIESTLVPGSIPLGSIEVRSAELVADQYTGRGTEAVLRLRIHTLTDLAAGQTRNYRLKLRASRGDSPEFPFTITGLDEMDVSGTLTWSNEPRRKFSRVYVAEGARVNVTGGTLDWEVTGPVYVGGTIDARGATGPSGNGPLGGAGRTGSGSSPLGGAGGNEGQAGFDADATSPANSPVFFYGFGGARGSDTNHALDLFQDALEACGDPNSDDCREFFSERVIELDLDAVPGSEDYDYSDSLPTGKAGWGGFASRAGLRPRAGHGGGGGGGTGHMDVGPGGGGGAGGEGGKGLRIVSGGLIEVTGAILTRGGDGGNGASALDVENVLIAPSAPVLAELLVSGGGGGGGGGGELIARSATGVFIGDPATGMRAAYGSARNRWLDAHGGDGGFGGLFVVDRTVSGSPRTVVQRGLPARAPLGQPGCSAVGGPVFRTLEPGATSLALIDLTEIAPLASPGGALVVHGPSGEVRMVRVRADNHTEPVRLSSGETPSYPLPPFRARILLFPGFNTIVTPILDEHRDGEPVDAAVYATLFTRIVCLPGPDADGDGIPDAEEAGIGGNPSLTDTDGDGIADGDEWINGTHPGDADTDADGIPDPAETSTDPLDADSDDDGLADGLEEILGPTASECPRGFPKPGTLFAQTHARTGGEHLTIIDPLGGLAGPVGKPNLGSHFQFAFTIAGDTFISRGFELARVTRQECQVPDSAAVPAPRFSGVIHTSSSSGSGSSTGGRVVVGVISSGAGGGHAGGVSYTTYRVDPLRADASGNLPLDSPMPLGAGGIPVRCDSIMESAGFSGFFHGIEAIGAGGTPAPTGQLVLIDRLAGNVIRLGAPAAGPVTALAELPGPPPQLVAVVAANALLGETADKLMLWSYAGGAMTPIGQIRDSAGNGFREVHGLAWHPSGKLYASTVDSFTLPLQSRLLEVNPLTAVATPVMSLPRVVRQLGVTPCAPPCFGPPRVSPSPLAYPARLLALDFDNDSFDDLALVGMLSPSGARAAFFRNDHAGGLSLDGPLLDLGLSGYDVSDAGAYPAAPPPPATPVSLPAAAFAFENSRPFTYFSNDGVSPRFETISTTTGIPDGEGVRSFVFADFNADLVPDIIAATQGGMNYRPGLATGVFGAVSLVPDSAPPAAHLWWRFLRAVDFEGDGDADLIAQSLAGLAVWRNIGPGAFATPVVSFRSFEFPGMHAGDFTGDGIADVVTVLYDTAFLHAGEAAGTFVSPVAIPLKAPHPIWTTGDMNHDGRPDLLLAYPNQPRLHVLLATGSGAGTVFVQARHSPFELPGVPSTLTAGDFDGDGRDDDVAGAIYGTPSGNLFLLTQ